MPHITYQRGNALVARTFHYIPNACITGYTILSSSYYMRIVQIYHGTHSQTVNPWISIPTLSLSLSLFPPPLSLSLYAYFYLESAIYFWHYFPDPARSSPTIGILKGRLFGHLFGLDNDSDAHGSLWVLVLVWIALGSFTFILALSCCYHYALRSL